MTNEAQTAVRILWDYMQLKQALQPADALILLGSRDDRVAGYAAGLLQNNIAPICVVTGGIAHGHDLLATKWSEESEADHFIAILRAGEIDEIRIYREAEATNTGQNAALSYTLLQTHQIHPKSILIITKPYMERRALATFRAQWQDSQITMRVSSVGGSIDEYCNDDQPLETVINIMVGDFQRIVEYPKKGLMESQYEIPQSVRNAYQTLIMAGFTNHLIQND